MQPYLIFTPPRCPACKQERFPLGQWAAWDKRTYLCRECCQRFAIPAGAISEDGLGLNQSREAFDARAHYHRLADAMARIRSGCELVLEDKHISGRLDCDLMHAGGRIFYLEDCAKCRRDSAYATEIERRGYHALVGRRTAGLASNPFKPRTYSLPACQRCGDVLPPGARGVTGDYPAHCAQCEAELSAESFWRMRAIFGNDDDEEILTRIERSHPQLFERGILPDYWFKMRLAERTEKP